MRSRRLPDKGGARTVLEQAANQVGEELATLADRGVYAHAQVRTRLFQRGIERFPHAVQSLELESAGARLGERQHAGGRNRVVRRELRENEIGALEHLRRGLDIGPIGVAFVGEDGIARDAQLLRALHLRVPIRALYQAHAQLRLAATREVDYLFERLQHARLVSLHGEAEALPGGKRLRQRGEKIQVQRQALRFLGVDGKPDLRLRRERAQFEQTLQQFRSCVRVTGGVIARMDRGKLDRHTEAIARSGRRLDRGAVALEIACGILRRARPFAQHVERIAVARRALGAQQSFFDSLGVHELPADQLRAQIHRQHGHSMVQELVHQRATVPGLRSARKRLDQPEQRLAQRLFRRQQCEHPLNVQVERRALRRQHTRQRPCSLDFRLGHQHPHLREYTGVTLMNGSRFNETTKLP